MIAGGECAQPGPRQCRVLGCKPGNRLDDDQMREAFGRRSVGQQQVTDIVVRVTQHQTDVGDPVTGAQSLDQCRQQSIERFRLQQAPLAALRTSHLVRVTRDLRTRLFELPSGHLELGSQFLDARHSLNSAVPGTRAPFPSARRMPVHRRPRPFRGSWRQLRTARRAARARTC